jgi:hypothetical protein
MQIEISPEVARGVYANFVSVWHDRDGFTFDFAANMQPPVASKDEETGAPVVLVHAQIVSRVRVPPSQMFEIMKTLEIQLSAWERETGSRPDP